ncbi:MAG: hypothetical protein ACRC33_18075 [Gemmataceae bacterium]
MLTGWKVFGGSAVALAVVLLLAGPAGAQPPSKRGESVAALEAQLSLLKKMTAEVEGKLKEAKAGEKKGGFRPFGPRWFGKMDMKEMAEMMERFRGKFGDKGPKRDKGEKKEPEKGSNREIEERLERLAKEIEEIRRSLKK